MYETWKERRKKERERVTHTNTSQWYTTLCLLDWAESKTVTTPSINENGITEILSLLMGMQIGATTFENTLVISYKNFILIIWTRHHIPCYIHEFKIYIYTKLHKNITFIHNWSKVRATKMFFTRWKRKLC